MNSPFYTFANIVAPDTVVDDMREICEHLSKEHCTGMFTLELSVAGTAPAISYMSTGLLPTNVAAALRDPALCFSESVAAWDSEGKAFPFTEQDVIDVLAACDITDGTAIKTLENGETVTVPESWQQVLLRLDLKIVSTPAPGSTPPAASIQTPTQRRK